MTKKLSTAILITLLAALLIGCSPQEAAPVVEEAPPVVEEAAPAEESAPAEEEAPASEAALFVAGVGFSREQLEGMDTLTAESTKKDGSTVEYTGVLVEGLLAEAGAAGDVIVFVASDGYEAELDLAELEGCLDCIVAFDEDELRMVLPGLPSSVQVKGVVEINVK